MSNLFSTSDGYYYEVQNETLNYLGPALPEGVNQQVIAHIQMVFSWFKSSHAVLATTGLERDDALARAFSELLGGEALISPNRLQTVIRLDEAA